MSPKPRLITSRRGETWNKKKFIPKKTRKVTKSM